MNDCRDMTPQYLLYTCMSANIHQTVSYTHMYIYTVVCMEFQFFSLLFENFTNVCMFSAMSVMLYDSQQGQKNPLFVTEP